MVPVVHTHIVVIAVELGRNRGVCKGSGEPHGSAAVTFTRQGIVAVQASQRQSPRAVAVFRCWVFDVFPYSFTQLLIWRVMVWSVIRSSAASIKALDIITDSVVSPSKGSHVVFDRLLA